MSRSAPRASGHFRTDYGQDLEILQTRSERVSAAKSNIGERGATDVEVIHAPVRINEALHFRTRADCIQIAVRPFRGHAVIPPVGGRAARIRLTSHAPGKCWMRTISA